MAYETRQLFNFIQGSDISGESAYDVWKRLGNEGTEADFLEFIRSGPKGEKGDPAYTYGLAVSENVMKLDASDVLVPASITFSGYYRIGIEATRYEYPGKLVIQETTNGSTWETKYESAANEYSKVYTPSSHDVKFIKCTLYSSIAEDAIELDTQSVAVLTDAETIVAILSNEAHVVATDANGNGGDFSECNTDIKVFSGVTDVTDIAIYEVIPSDGITGSWDLTNYTYTVTGLSVDTGYVDIVATHKGVSVIKRFTVSKSKTGKSAYEIWLEIEGNEGKTEQEFLTEIVNKPLNSAITSTEIELKSYTDTQIEEFSENVAFIEDENNDIVTSLEYPLTTNHIVDNVESSNSRLVLSAKQGKMLNSRISNIVAHNNDTDGNTELLDIRVGTDGTTYDSAGDAVRAQVNQLSSEIAYNTVNVESFLHEAIAVEKLDSSKILRGTLIGFGNGVNTSNSKYDATVLIPTVSRYLRMPLACVIHCYDENQNWLRATAPLKQGNIIRAYLGDDVKYIAFSFENGDAPYDYFTFIWTDYIFDFKGKEVDYYYTQPAEGWTQNNNAKSIEYVFEFHFLGIPIYGIPSIYVGCNGLKATLTKGYNTVAYSSNKVGDATVTVTLPYYTKDSCIEYKAQIGRELPTLNVCCYGTSITNINSEGKYPIALQSMLNCDNTNFVARGVSGGKYTTNIKEKILSFNDSFDLIVLEGCANDWYFGETIEDMRTAIHEIMAHLSDKATNIVFVTDHTNRSYGSMVGGANHVINGLTSREYYLKCAEIFASYGVITIDAGMLSGINEFKSEMYVDQIHHSNLGGYIFAKAIYNELVRLGLFKNN